MKTPPIKYINQKKMEQAQLYFLITDKRIKDIAFSVGYNNVSYFNRIFKKYTGVSPLAYRRKYQKE